MTNEQQNRVVHILKVNVVNEKFLDSGCRIAVGTVQFGMNYSMNESGKVELEEVRKILSYARGHQIDTLDTAIVYGDSERVLGGRCFRM